MKTYAFEKVNDRRGQPVLGLWNRNGRFYFQTKLPGDKSPRKVALRDDKDQPVQNLKEAQQAIEKFKQNTAEGVVPTKLRAPNFEEHVAHYLATLRATHKKTEITLKGEEYILGGWADFLGNIPLTHITLRHLNDYALERKEDEISNRTINLGIIALHSCLSLAVEMGVLRRAVTADWKCLPYKAAKKELRTFGELSLLVAEAGRTEGGVPVYSSGQMLIDYLKLLAFSGARRNSGLAVQWTDIKCENRRDPPRTVASAMKSHVQT